ncbi:MAG: site-specific integrase [Pseudomonadota bacterium]
MIDYGVCRNTVSNWVQSGLATSDNKRPHLFRGSQLSAFHKARRERSRTTLLAGEFKCRVCDIAVCPPRESIDFKVCQGREMLIASCPECRGVVTKISSKPDRGLLVGCINPNTPGESSDEEIGLPLGDIGTEAEILHCQNDRLFYVWQGYANKYDVKTADSHLAAIRDLEVFLDGKPFDKLNRDDLSSYRNHLRELLKVEGRARLSRSTVSHRLSHLRAFVTWLRMQEGYKRLPEDLAGYLELPRSSLAMGPAGRLKEQPTIKEAEDLLRAMPDRTVKQRRARAIFATAFLGALRADTLISLQIKHVQVECWRIIQDPTVSRVKNGKALTIQWFPIPDLFAQTLIGWVEDLQSYGFADRDALFPNIGLLSKRVGHATQPRAPIAAMTSKKAVTEAFKAACKGHIKSYTPHSARRTIGGLRDILSLTNEQRKAWSLNMGHEKEPTTDTFYANIPDDHRFELIERSDHQDSDSFLEGLSDSEKVAAFNSLMEKLIRKNRAGGVGC